MARKKSPNSYNECIYIRLTIEQKETWVKNKWIADEVREIVRKHLNLYVMKK